MSPQAPDLLALAAALDRPGLRWVLIGGLALALHGGAYPTMDADIAFASDVENLDHLVEGLAPLHPRPLRMAAGSEYTWDRLSLSGPWVHLMTDAGRVDLIRLLSGIDSFEGLYERAEERTLNGVTVRFASLDDLIAIKSQSDRAKDKLQLLELLALKHLKEAPL